MFYKLKTKDFIRFPPASFKDDVKEELIKEVKKEYEGYTSKELGLVMDVIQVVSIGDGIIVPGDGGSYYETEFELLTFKPELHEVVQGQIKDIADFGAFLSMGPVDGMVHVSQAMNDFVSFSKEKILSGKESNRLLKIGDICKAKIVAISFKDPSGPKIGLTMRQEGLGKLEWIEEDFSKQTLKKTSKKENKK